MIDFIIFIVMKTLVSSESIACDLHRVEVVCNSPECKIKMPNFFANPQSTKFPNQNTLNSYIQCHCPSCFSP